MNYTLGDAADATPRSGTQYTRDAKALSTPQTVEPCVANKLMWHRRSRCASPALLHSYGTACSLPVLEERSASSISAMTRLALCGVTGLGAPLMR